LSTYAIIVILIGRSVQLENIKIKDGKYIIDHQLLFQTPLFEIHLKDVDNKVLEENIYSLRDIDEGVKVSNKKGWHSDYIFPDNENIELFKPLITELPRVLKHLPFKPIISEVTNIAIWANISDKYSYNTAHNHPGCDISGVYYVKVPEGDCGNILFNDPRHSWVYGNRFFVERYSGGETAPRFPVEGNMYLFPSCIDHAVEQNNTDEDRISISFNLNLR